MRREREYTLNLGSWCMGDLRELGNMLIAYADRKHGSSFDDSDSMVADYNPNSGNVYLWSEDWPASLLYREYTRENACAPTKELYPIYSTPYKGDEGEWSELCDMFFDLHHEDQEWFLELDDDDFDNERLCGVVKEARPSDIEDAWERLTNYFTKRPQDEIIEFISAASEDWSRLSTDLQEQILEFVEQEDLASSFPSLILSPEEEEEEEEDNETIIETAEEEPSC